MNHNIISIYNFFVETQTNKILNKTSKYNTVSIFINDYKNGKLTNNNYMVEELNKLFNEFQYLDIDDVYNISKQYTMDFDPIKNAHKIVSFEEALFGRNYVKSQF